MRRDSIINEYFNWLYGLVQGRRYSGQVSFRKLLMRLHDTEFRYSLPRDQNTADAGVDLRYRFAVTQGYEDDSDLVMDYLEGPCSVLEMMVALSVYCEQHIMDDPNIGDRTSQWFWEMIVNMGLGSMTDPRFDKHYVDDVVERMLDREYDPDGRGGLFTVRHCDQDLRDVAIFHQLCWYINTIT